MSDLRKPSHHHVDRRIFILVLMICVVVLLAVVLSQSDSYKESEPEYALPDYGEVMVHPQSSVKTLQVSLRDGDSWTLRRESDGSYYVDGEDGFPVSEITANRLTGAAAVISYNDVLSKDPSEYMNHLEEFGLADPRLIVKVEYDDAAEISFRVGDRSPLADDTWYYMIIDGQEGLFALDFGTM